MRVRIEAHDSGRFVEDVWGHEDYEFWTEVNGRDLPALLHALRQARPEPDGPADDAPADTSDKAGAVFALLRERFDGDPAAISSFAEFCERNGIPQRFEMWP